MNRYVRICYQSSWVLSDQRRQRSCELCASLANKYVGSLLCYGFCSHVTNCCYSLIEVESAIFVLLLLTFCAASVGNSNFRWKEAASGSRVLRMGPFYFQASHHTRQPDLGLAFMFIFCYSFFQFIGACLLLFCLISYTVFSTTLCDWLGREILKWSVFMSIWTLNLSSVSHLS